MKHVGSYLSHKVFIVTTIIIRSGLVHTCILPSFLDQFKDCLIISVSRNYSTRSILSGIYICASTWIGIQSNTLL